jgi:hypothetical protein
VVDPITQQTESQIPFKLWTAFKKKLLPDDAGMISVCWGGCMPTIQPH